MQLFRTTKARSGNDDNVIPLINIVFLMLIFFMLAGQITSTDVLNVMPPTSETQAPTTPLEFEILMDAEGSIAFNNQTITYDGLRTELEVLNTPDVQISLALKIDADVTAETLKPLLKLLSDSGMQQITLYTRQTRSAS
ncbi:ExbD/TolR family protein [Nitrincola schmidtii]|uniref:ExbD/TolR family protein n=1 Tax=Nitrincola schmidtii TaxID=1730894 RepID=UPI00124F6AAD|nr:biopolymer transporter ExbD [Nitrincola schmidtii]